MLLVFGSINMDLVVRTPRLPGRGETITGREFYTTPGGKGANQAVAAARMGAPTKMIGRVGDDNFGAALRQRLAAYGVDCAEIVVDSTVSSGVALITIDDEGQNSIIVVAGANGRVDQNDVDRMAAHLPRASALLLQLEIPLAAVVEAARLARAKGVTAILDPAPAQQLPAGLYPLLDIITPNEVEAAQLVGFPIKGREAAFRAADVLVGKGVKTAVVTLGAAGVIYVSEDPVGRGFVPASAVEAVDTVAAGDAFNGGLATALSEGRSLPEAVRWGAATAALSVTKSGAQASLPTREEVVQLLGRESRC